MTVFRALRRILPGALLVGVLCVVAMQNSTPVKAVAGINQQINFQGRLLTGSGATVADGYYNIEFKIYQDGAGTAANNPGGTLKWTEDWLNVNSKGVMVKNGYLSVQLGSITSLSSVDWNQDTLWLSINIGNTNTTCTPFTSCGGDGEMLPMKRLASTPYALNAGMLGGKTAAGFIQNTTTAQAANIAVQSAASTNVGALVQGAVGQSVDILQVKTAAGGAPVFAVGSTGSVSIQPATDGSALTVKDSSGNNLVVADTAAGRLSIGSIGTAAGQLYVGGKLPTAQTGSVATGITTTASNITVQGRYAYVTGTQSGTTKLSIIDISDPTSLTALGSVTDSTGSNGGQSAVSGNMLYTTSADRLVAFNAGNQNAPVSGGTASIAGGNGAGMAVSGRYAFTTSGTTFYAYDITGTTVGAATSNGVLTGSGTSIQTQGNYAYVGTTTNVSIINITTPQTAASMTQVGTVAYGSAVTDVEIMGRYVYAISAAGNNMKIIDVKNPATPAVVSTLALPASCTPTGLNIQDRYAYIACSGGTSGIQVADISSVTAPTLIGSGIATGIAMRDVTAAGRYLYAIDTSNNLRSYDVGGAYVQQLEVGTVEANGMSVLGAASFGGTVNLRSGLQVAKGAQINGGISATGNATFRSDTNGAGTFAVQNATGGNLLSVDSASETITVGGSAAASTITKTAQTTANTAGAGLTIQGATGNGTGAGGALTIQGGTSGATGVGGNLILNGGTGSTGTNGLVVISTPTFSTTLTDANCYTGGALVASSCTIAQSSVNNSSAIIVGFTTLGQTASLPNPTTTTAGRVVYITAANGSNDFTLSVNGGGTGNQIAMRQNTTATMIWSGTAWTAAGASSSTTLQSAYDNTLQSAGGAELVVSKTSTTSGLTIRDSTVNPVNGTLLSVQTKSAAGLFQVNSNVTEYVSNAGAETAGGTSTTFPASTWGSVGAATVSRYTVTGSNIATGQGSVSVATTAAAQDGTKNTLTSALTSAQTYNVSFAARLSSGTFNDMNVYYSVDGTAASVACTSGQTIATSVWTKINCTFTAPSSGITAANAILIRQTAGTARTFYVDNLSVTIAADYNYATDGMVNDGVNFATNWSSVSGATTSRTTTAGNDASDSAQVVTTATAGQGVRNKLSINPLPSTLYRVTVYAASSNAFTDFTIRYSRDGGTNFVSCADYNTQTLSTSTGSFTKITCYITTDATNATSPYVYFTQTAGTARTFYVDTFSLNLSSSTTPNVQIGGGLNGGPTTLFTLDRGSSAPIASNNDALLGSMYYDTTLGKLQCYEADGWGACGSSPDNIITISPEYTNAVLHGTGIGTMTSDLCSSTLAINDGTSGQPTICGSGETYNFYKWTSPQASAQTYSIYVTYQLPSSFKNFNSGQTSLMGRTDNGASGGTATVAYQIYRNSGSGLTSCGTSITVSTGTVGSWQVKTATGAADPSTCSFTAGNSIVFKIDIIASKNANAYVGNLNFSFNNR